MRNSQRIKLTCVSSLQTCFLLLFLRLHSSFPRQTPLCLPLRLLSGLHPTCNLTTHFPLLLCPPTLSSPYFSLSHSFSHFPSSFFSNILLPSNDKHIQALTTLKEIIFLLILLSPQDTSLSLSPSLWTKLMKIIA